MKNYKIGSYLAGLIFHFFLFLNLTRPKYDESTPFFVN